MFKSTGLAKMFAGRRKFFRGPHVRHLCYTDFSKYIPLGFSRGNISESHHNANTVVKHTRCDCEKLKSVILGQVTIVLKLPLIIHYH